MTKPPVYAPIAVVIAVAVAVATTNVSQEPGAVKTNQDKTTTSQVAAKKLYLRDCAMCHGENGNGQTDMARDMQLQLSDLSDPKTLANKQDEQLFKTIRNGLDKMPPEAVERAKDDEIHSLIQYVRSLSKTGALSTNSSNTN